MPIRPALKARSLRSWIVLAMVLAFAPIVVSAGAGFILLERGVIAPVHDIAFRQREQIEPVQNLRVMIWDAMVPVDEYVEDGDPSHVAGYRSLRVEVEAEMARLIQSSQDMPPVQALIKRAHQTWSDADGMATSLMSARATPGASEITSALGQYHAAIMATSDRLKAAYQQLAERIDEDHDVAVRSYERSLWIAGIAAGISLIALVGGVLMIGRILAGSVDRLVEGAARFAEGDRHHRIQVAVPPELSRVAEEFNYMIGRIDESEKALAELAHVDSLTGISNRRAFDASFAEALANHIRTGAPASLLAIDLDHFKRINDTWGHPAGDEVLRVVTSVMSESLRRTDRLFRMGGEEFCIVMTGASLEEAREVAERLRLAVTSRFVHVKAAEISVTVSIGIVGFHNRIDREELLASADAALYQAKSGGRNRICVDDSGGKRDQNLA